MEYRRHEQPGCGCGFILIFFLFLLVANPGLLLGFLGALFYTGLFLAILLVAGFWGFTYFVKRKISEYEKSQTETHNTFVFLLIRVLVKVAQIDGKVTRAEINTIHHFFQYNLRYSHNQLLWVKELVKEAMKSDESIEELLTEFRQKFTYEPRIILIELVYQVLHTNEQVSEAELHLVRNIAEYLEISQYDQQTIEAKYRTGFRATAATEERLEDKYYAILGLEPSAGFNEIKTAYRRLSMKYHPDKVSHLGEEFKTVAEEKMKELNVAYEYLKKKFQ